ncbi:hypothetical protein BCR44DRAFT_1401525 [Catenaria anguillulae PL171]|uniref:NodB homology domain-containing protein n=1 Tax=Catenaria anguillulae PL171 TaxID=765915 RepID=A0A1Y2HRQ7_9FUNG|nr:hypothetical protein BCR44DRAFT_1401525 [Catenaria anguillulae PL171]
MKIAPLFLVCLLPLLVAAQLVDDFTAPFAVEGVNNLGFWRGGEGVSGVAGGVAITDYWAEVITGTTTCNDLTGKSIKFAYTSATAGQRTLELHLKASTCQGARASIATTQVNVNAGSGELTVPVTAFAGANVRLGFAITFKGPITIRRVEIVGGSTPPPPSDPRCVLPSADVGGCSADRLCPNGLCCSEYGWCGNTDAYCNSKCQSQCDLRPVPGLRTCGSTPDPNPQPNPSIPDPAANAVDWVPSGRLTNGRFERGDFGSFTSCGWNGMIAITYDDGPVPSVTTTILNALRDANVKTTFFWLGSLIRDNKALARRGAAEGHHLASHSWSHPDLTTLSAADLNNEIVWTENEIRDVVGLRPRFFRPPYGNLNQAVYNRLVDAGYRVIIWNFDTNDWQGSVTAAGILEQYRTQAINPGSKSYISLQHDIQPKSAEIASRVYQQVRTNGFKPIPMYICLNEYAYQR